MIDKHHAEHYSWGAACDGWHLVRGADLSVIEERMPSHTSEIRHAHARARQFFWIISGVATIELEGVTHSLGAEAGH